MSSHAFRETGISVRIYKRGDRTWTASFRVAGRKIQRSTGEDRLQICDGDELAL